MTTVNKSNFLYSSSTPSKRESLPEFFRQHRLLAILIIIGFITFCVAFLIVIFSPKKELRIPEKAPYLIFENESLIEDSVPAELGKEILFILNLVLIRSDEIQPVISTDNSDGNHYIASIEEKSYNINSVPSIPDGRLYTMDINISDGRKYELKILYNEEYHNEYAVAILDYLGSSDNKDYIITFTSPTKDYYTNLDITDQTVPSKSSDTTDFITGIPLLPLPTPATNWIKSLKLTNPETINDTLPSLR